MPNWLRILLAVMIIALAGAYWYYRAQVQPVQFVPTEAPTQKQA